MATSNKNFKIKNGLIVEGSSATVNGNNVLTSASSINDLTDVSIASPANSQILAYESATSLWKNINFSGGGGSTVTVSATPPTDPAPTQGNQWFDSSTGTTYIYYDNFWVAVSPPKAGPIGPTGPTGPIGATGPAGDTGAASTVTGPTGPSGVISVTGPITNSGTSTSANIGIDLSNIAPISSPTFTGTIVGAPAEPDTNSNTAKNLGYIGMPQVILNSGNLTLSKAHSGQHIYVTGSSQTITIPANASVPLEIGTTIIVINANVTSSIAITSDTLRLAGTETTGTRTLAVNGMATLIKIAATTWIASGNGLS